MNKKKIWKWFKIALLIYLAVGIAFYFFQDKILFSPVKLDADYKYNFSYPHKEVNIPVNEESNLNIIQFLSTDTVTKGVVLYFHGNKKNVSWYAKYAPYFTKHGYEVWIMDYPGFGKSTGEFKEKTLYQWAMNVYTLAATRFAADSIVIYGKSLGTCIATQLASRKDCKELILETPYYDFPQVIKRYLPIYPIDNMISWRLPTWSFLSHVKAPVTIFQGTNDWVVSHGNASMLKPYMKKGDEFVSVKKGKHNNLLTFKEVSNKLDSLLSR